MILIPVQLPPGLERNNTPYDTPNSWFDMNLVRWQSGTMRPVMGWNRLTSTPLDSALRKIHVYRDNANQRNILIGTDAKLYTGGDVYTDITPAAFVALSSIGTAGGYGSGTAGTSTYGTARPSSPIFSPYAYWTFDNWGQDVILTANSDGRLFYYNTAVATTAPGVITTAPTGNNAVVVTDERHVMAIGQAGGGGSQRRVAWSSREDFADWNFASVTNTAGFQDLTTRSPLLKGVKVREGVLIFSRSAVWLAQYIGQPFIFGFNRISDAEMMHPDSIATFNGKAAWLSRSGFQLYNGGAVSAIDCPILGDIQKEMDTTFGEFRIHGSHNGIFTEIWWFYPTAGNTEANRYVIWNYTENWWAWGMLSRSAMVPAETYRAPFMGSAAGNFYEHETGYKDAGASRVGSIFVKSGVLGDTDVALDINAIVLANGTGFSKVAVTAYTQMTPEGAVRTFGPYNPRSNGWTDTRINGRGLQLMFQSMADEEWGIGKTQIDTARKSGGARR